MSHARRLLHPAAPERRPNYVQNARGYFFGAQGLPLGAQGLAALWPFGAQGLDDLLFGAQGFEP
jgi:hypothetical protein